MPVILKPAAWPIWLSEVEGDHGTLLRPAAERTVRLWPVSRAVNNVRNNGRDLLDEVVDPGTETREGGTP
jgi:putative SOS response-associated peptidase YedK